MTQNKWIQKQGRLKTDRIYKYHFYLKYIFKYYMWSLY